MDWEDVGDAALATVVVLLIGLFMGSVVWIVANAV